MKVLFASSEAWPLIKTGGLGDVSYSLPQALHKEGADLRLVLPAYREVLEKLGSVSILGWLSIPLAGKQHDVRLLHAEHPKFSMPIWLIDAPQHFDRPGNPYLHPDGYDWMDNAERFALFSKAVACLAYDPLQLGWKPDIVHSHDWQTGLVSAFLEEEAERPRRVFTIHNLAYGGYFSQDEYRRLQLPWPWWSPEGVEFYGSLSMLKAGIIYSDAVTTVSPTYAKEICTPTFGYGLEGVLSARHYKLSGILNGIDTEAWNPNSDPLLPVHFSAQNYPQGKRQNKQVLLESYGIKATKEKLDAPLLGMVSRLVEQKGTDMIIDAIPAILAHSSANFTFVGSGQAYFEQRLRQLGDTYPDRVFVTIGYSEEKAHLLEAACDMYLMPSRFEPCGLNQMYSLRYGTLPIVHRTGGLADTVIDAEKRECDKSGNIRHSFNTEGNGFVFNTANTDVLIQTIERALAQYAHKKHWQRLQRNAMLQDFGWEKSAKAYINVYQNN